MTKVHIGILVDEDLAKEIKRAASAEGRTRSGWIKWVIQRFLKKGGSDESK